MHGLIWSRRFTSAAPEHGEEAWERFGDDTGAVAMSYLALTSWQLGEVERARVLIDTANQRAAKIGHGPSRQFRSIGCHIWKSYAATRPRYARLKLWSPLRRRMR